MALKRDVRLEADRPQSKRCVHLNHRVLQRPIEQPPNLFWMKIDLTSDLSNPDPPACALEHAEDLLEPSALNLLHT